jgi:AraC-like DNA-binding protein
MIKNNSNSYGFRLKGAHQERVAGLHAIGREVQTELSYRWDGMRRAGENGRVVFQYTLNGKGAIRIGNHVTTLTKGQAFLVQFPSDHCYYLPDDSNEWEFIYISVYGTEATRFYEHMQQSVGNIISMPTNAKPIRHIYRVLEKLETVGVYNSYEASSYAYSFLMEVMQYFEYEQQTNVKIPIPIQEAISFIEKNYDQDIGLEDIVEVSQLSKYHFTRLFAKYTNQTPIQYVTKIRMQQAIELLKQKELSIEEIAIAVGYTNANYFSKVFKQLLHITPSKYRNNDSFMPVDQLIID